MQALTYMDTSIQRHADMSHKEHTETYRHMHADRHIVYVSVQKQHMRVDTEKTHMTHILHSPEYRFITCAAAHRCTPLIHAKLDSYENTQTHDTHPCRRITYEYIRAHTSHR